MEIGKSHRYRKAISPLIATLILIAIAVVGGVVVYRLFYSTAGTLTTSLHASVSEATASAAGGFTASIKNDGSVGITSLSVAISGETLTMACSPTVSSGSPMAPGATVSCTLSSGTGYVAPTNGASYAFTATVSGSGSSYIASLTVVATS